MTEMKGTKMNKEQNLRKKSAFTLAERILCRVMRRKPQTRGYEDNSEWQRSEMSDLSEIKQNPRRKVAFTLAEVLITLGIIGVVAALTLPSLIENHNKKVWTTALQKNYSVIEQGFQKMKSDDGVDNLEDTTAFSSMSGDCSFNIRSGTTVSSGCESFLPELKKYFNVNVVTAPDYQTYNLNGVKWGDYTGRQLLAFPDGTVMMRASFHKTAGSSDYAAQIKAAGGHMLTYQGFFDIDVNGFKKPNTYGRDIFSFDIGGDGKLYPEGGKDISLFSSGFMMLQYWRKDSSRCGTPENSNATKALGYCAARIMENGWKMDY